MKSRATVPWSNHRQVLWAVGVLGLLFLAFAFLVGWFLQGGFDPDLKHLRDVSALIFELIPAAPCVYYIVVAHGVWNRTMW